MRHSKKAAVRRPGRWPPPGPGHVGPLTSEPQPPEPRNTHRLLQPHSLWCIVTAVLANEDAPQLLICSSRERHCCSHFKDGNTEAEQRNLTRPEPGVEPSAARIQGQERHRLCLRCSVKRRKRGLRPNPELRLGRTVRSSPGYSPNPSPRGPGRKVGRCGRMRPVQNGPPQPLCLLGLGDQTRLGFLFAEHG